MLTRASDEDVGMSMNGHRSLRQRREHLEHEWTRLVPRLRAVPGPLVGDTALRAEVRESWSRSLGSVDPGTDQAPLTDGGEVRSRWSDSPLRGPVTRLDDQLRGIADDAGFVAAVTDGTGTILWTCGGRVMRRQAERVNFAPGGRWDEQAMGTNALSLALRTGMPSQVFSAEHLVAALHGWVCYCAPIRDPRGAVLGVLDLSTTWDRSHPLAMATVRSLVSTIETSLHADLGGPPAPAVGVRCLGQAQAHRGGVPLRLRPRQVEILALLALEPDGFTPEGLRDAVYGDRPVSAATLKADVSHLRAALGGALATRRYALTAPVACDAVDVLRALERGDTAAAVRAYRGPLLPRSDAPGITCWRDHIEVAVREAVLASAEPEHALAYGGHAPYDTAVHEHALRWLAPSDARRGIAAGRLAAALRD